MPVDYGNAENIAAPIRDRPIMAAISKGLKCKCPNCGEGNLFRKYLKVAPACDACGENLSHEKADDLPPYITISIVGHIVVTLLMIVEAHFDLSMLAHLLIWVPLTIVLTFALMQPVKGAVVGLQWANRMFGFGSGYVPR